MTEKLKPCPFCGGEAKTRRGEDGASLIVCCPTCSKGWNLKEEAPGERWAADFDFCGWDRDDDDAVVAAWNRRAIDLDELLAVADECEAADADGASDWAARIRRAVGE